METRLDHRLAGDGHPQVARWFLTEVEEAELELVLLALDGDMLAGGPSQSGDIEVSTGVVIKKAALDARQRAAQQPAAAVEQQHLRFGLGPHIGEHRAQWRLQQDATDHLVADHDRTGRAEAARRGSLVADEFVAQGVVGALQDRPDDRVLGKVGAARENQAAGVAGVWLIDLENHPPADVKNLDGSKMVVDLERDQELAQCLEVAGLDSLVDTLSVGDQSESRDLPPLQLDRRVEGVVLRLHQLLGNALLKRGGHQAGGQVGADHPEDQHQQQEGQDDLGPDLHRGDPGGECPKINQRSSSSVRGRYSQD
jgi:hypothetical protein